MQEDNSKPTVYVEQLYQRSRPLLGKALLQATWSVLMYDTSARATLLNYHKAQLLVSVFELCTSVQKPTVLCWIMYHWAV